MSLETPVGHHYKVTLSQRKKTVTNANAKLVCTLPGEHGVTLQISDL